MNVLVIAPHPDDECIGCGGALCRHVAKGDRVTAVFLTSGELGLKHLSREQAQRTREAEAITAAKVLGLTATVFLRMPDWALGQNRDAASAALKPVIAREGPQIIYLPHPADQHPDHQVALLIVQGACGTLPGGVPPLRLYEVWTPLSAYQHLTDITAYMPRKLRALRRHKSQVSSWDYVRAVRGLNEYRGAMGGRCRYAEVFAVPDPLEKDNHERTDLHLRDDQESIA